MLKKSFLVFLASMFVASGALAQKRAARAENTAPRKAVRLEQAEAAPEKTKRITTSVMPKNRRATRSLHDSSILKAPVNVTPPKKILGDGTTIYGGIIYPYSIVYGNGGIYSFKADVNPDVTRAYPFTSYDPDGGGVYVDGKYYYFSYVYAEEYQSYTFVTYLSYDPATGQQTRINTQSFLDGVDETQVTHDLTYDPTTGNVYAVSYIIETDDTGLLRYVRPAVSTVDLTLGFVTPIAATPQFIAIAANTAGELYAISKGNDSGLYRVNKTTGECTLIGKTGLNPEYTQSATFDPVTDKLYWAETELNGTSALYEVNIKTGAAEKICDFINDEEFVGLYIPSPEINAAAPAIATDQTATFVNDALTGSIDFTAPTKTYAGATLSGNLTAEITIDGVAQPSMTVTPGQKVSKQITVSEGIHSYTVQIVNAAGAGPRTGYSWYAGIDGPAPVTNLTVIEKDSKPFISWTAPTKGRNGGYIDPSKLTYTVTRMPEGVTVASNITSTSITDQTSFETSTVYYVVKAYCDGREGAEASSDTGVFGSGSQLPVTYTFDNPEEFELCYVLDANKDADYQYHWGYWMYSEDFPAVAGTLETPALVYGYNPTGPADDWVFMPPFTAEKGQKYRVTFKMWTRGDKEKLSVAAGPSVDPASQTVIMATKEYNHTTPAEYVTEFVANESGNYYVGFHCTSDSKKWYLFVDDVTIDIVPEKKAPLAVENLTVTPAEKGALAATISFTTPTLDGEGGRLASLSKVEIFRGNDLEAIYTLSNPGVGQNYSWTDNNAVTGFNTYRVVPSNTYGAGEKALATAYVGYDLPVAVTNLTLTDNGQYPVISWTAPTQGQNGGYINPDELIYRIIRSDNSILSRNATGTQFIDRTIARDPQSFIYYQVEPISQTGIGDYALTQYMVYGNPYEGDFYESFPDASLTTDPWVTEMIKGREQLWSLYSQGYSPMCYDANGDGGLIGFLSTYGYNGDEGRLISPKLSLTDKNVPVFSFAFFHSPDYYTLQGDYPYQDRLIPELLLPDGTYVALDEPIYVDDPTKDSSWYLYVYDLSQYKQYGYVQLVFHAIAHSENDIYIDMISLEDNSNYDLTGYTFSGPTAVKVGKTATYRTVILNQGMKEAENFSVELYRDGSLFATAQGANLKSGSTAAFEFPVTYTLADEGKTYSYYVNIVFDNDEVPSNNRSQTITTKVESPDVPEPQFVSHQLEGPADVKLTWGEPDGLHVTDSFEDYAQFTIDNIGDYKLVDGDKAYTYSFMNIYFDNDVDPKAYIVFNPYTIGLGNYFDDYNKDYDYLPHTGRQALAAFSAYQLDAQGYAQSVDNDDWLISPAVHGGSQVSFWAKAAFDYISEKEQFEVLYSTTDTNVSSFKRLSDGIITADYIWKEYTYTLPADAKYFAIHHVGNDAFIFMVDDLTFNQVCTLEGAEHTGFRIYRDDAVIGDVTKDTRSFTDTKVAEGTHTYAVSALFRQRESQRVPVTVVVGSGDVEDGLAASTTIRTEGRYIVIDGCDGLDVTVSDAAGICYFSADNAPSYRVNVAPGLYIVRAGNTVAKVVVR